MNKLYLRTVRRRAAGAFHLHNAWCRMRSTMDGAPLHAHWHRNTTAGVLECCWVADALVQSCLRLSSWLFTSPFRKQRRPYGAGKHPPSRRHANG